MAEKFFFHYKGNKIDVDKETLTGAEIKAAIKATDPSFDLTHELVLEGHGHETDRVIADTDTVSLARGHGEGAKHFFSKPPTNFGQG